MSNYPPGVTGNEPQIAGYAETTENMHCTATATLVPANVVSNMNRELAKKMQQFVSGSLSADEWQQRWTALLLESSREDDCGFEGNVELRIGSRTEAFWTCPWCGTEHEIDPSDYFADPDAGRD